jgi:methionyl-tRNA formyltransferase
MNILIFGSTDLTLSILLQLEKTNHRVVGIVTSKPDFKISYKPDGVVNTRHVDVSSWAEQRQIPVLHYENTEQVPKFIQSLTSVPDFCIVAGWYHMVPRKIRELFRRGCAGFHASLLPQFRGGAPLNWAILTGQDKTGVSFFELSDGVDDGLLYDQQEFVIEPEDDAGSLIAKADLAVRDMLSRSLDKIENDTLVPYAQVGEPSYSGQRFPTDGAINFNQGSDDILKLVRATSRPYPGAYGMLGDQKITIWKARRSDVVIHAVPGQITVVGHRPHITCVDGSIEVLDADQMDLLTKSAVVCSPREGISQAGLCHLIPQGYARQKPGESNILCSIHKLVFLILKDR